MSSPPTSSASIGSFALRGRRSATLIVAMIRILENTPLADRRLQRGAAASRSRRGRERADVRAVDVHDVQLRCLIAEPFVVESQIGDVPAHPGDTTGLVIRPASIRQCVNRVVRQIHSIDFRVDGLIGGIRRVDWPLINTALSIAAPCGGAVMLEVPARQLPCGDRHPPR